MTLSRTKKYKDLRDRLQHETSADNLSTTDLSRFEKRLNEIDSQNFAMPSSIRDEHNAEHARNHETEAKETTPLRRRTQEKSQPCFDTSSYYKNENDATFDNDYLDQYIREVKQYNIDQGNAASENTSLNILKQIERNNAKVPEKPYTKARDYTADIPFFSNTTKTQEERKEPVQDTQSTQPLTKEDIMAEVQNMVNGIDSNEQSHVETKEEVSSPFVSDSYHQQSTMSTDTFNRHIEADRTTRQQLLNETTQMRAQLDDYEDNLSEVTNKMRQTNRILNIVLIILIIALAIIVGIVIYFIMTSK